MLLALRGWGEADFRLAAPGFLSLVRFGVFAEFLAPALSGVEAVLNTPLPHDAAGKGDLVQRKIAAGELVPILRAALYPADDDG